MTARVSYITWETRTVRWLQEFRWNEGCKLRSQVSIFCSSERWCWLKDLKTSREHIISLFIRQRIVKKSVTSLHRRQGAEAVKSTCALFKPNPIHKNTNFTTQNTAGPTLRLKGPTCLFPQSLNMRSSGGRTYRPRASVELDSTVHVEPLRSPAELSQ